MTVMAWLDVFIFLGYIKLPKYEIAHFRWYPIAMKTSNSKFRKLAIISEKHKNGLKSRTFDQSHQLVCAESLGWSPDSEGQLWHPIILKEYEYWCDGNKFLLSLLQVHMDIPTFEKLLWKKQSMSGHWWCFNRCFWNYIYLKLWNLNDSFSSNFWLPFLKAIRYCQKWAISYIGNFA